ncbi:MAG: hypothetical protein JWP81_194 [Ferruginibacter sp.]|nr:hypothetical protein [Ferruginibacter sp.]
MKNILKRKVKSLNGKSKWIYYCVMVLLQMMNPGTDITVNKAGGTLHGFSLYGI